MIPSPTEKGLECFFILSLLLACARVALGSAPSLVVHWDADHAERFNVSIDGVLFARGSGPTSVLGWDPNQINVVNSTGQDILGLFEERRIIYRTKDDIAFETAVRVYHDQRILMFEQHWPSGAVDTTATPHPNGLLADFPVLDLVEPDARGLLTFGGRQLETCFAGPLTKTDFQTGDGGGGPVAIFDNKGLTMAVSPASEFMSSAWGKTHSSHHSASMAGTNRILAAGTLGSMTSLPRNFTVRTLAVAGSGPTEAIVDVGGKLLKLYDKNASAARANDLTLNTVGVSTDNGAYYCKQPRHARTLRLVYLPTAHTSTPHHLTFFIFIFFDLFCFDLFFFFQT